MTTSNLNPVAKTALLVAAMRAVENDRTEDEGKLFSDPYAKNLAGEEGLHLLKRALTEVGVQPAIAIRTRYIDDQINRETTQGLKQIVMLAAGMDSRAYRMNLSKDLKLFEIDQAEVLNYKKNILSKFQPTCDRISIGTDLRTDWTKSLLSSGFNKNLKTLWLIEGLVMYLEETEVIELFQKINSVAIKNDILLMDIMTRTLLETPQMAKQLDFLKSIGAPWKFGTNDPEKFLFNLGWNAETTQPGDYMPNRWPFPTAPKHIPNVPRGFYVKATKN